MASGFHIMGHVPDEGGFRWFEAVIGKDAVNQHSFVENARIGRFEVILEAEFGKLRMERVRVHRGENKHADAKCRTPFQLFTGIGKDCHR